MSAFDAEANVIGGCLLVPDAYWQVADLLSAGDFSRDEHRRAWESLEALVRSGAAIDVCTFADKNPKLAAFAYECANATPGAKNIRAWAEIVCRDAVTRRVRASGTRISNLAGDDVLGEAQRIVAACAPRMASAIKPVRTFLAESIALMGERCDSTEVLTGVPTSLDWLDEKLSGWQRGDLILLGARPSVGKTALALQTAMHAAKCGHPVLALSLEMSGAQLTDRLIAHASGVDMQRIRQPKQIEEEEWPSIRRAGDLIAGLPIQIDDSCGLTLEDVCARVRQVDAQTRLGLVVIDYLQIMRFPKADRHDLAVGMVSAGLKRLAKELRVPVVLLSQLNRDGINRPKLSDLRDSGSLEQDADVVVFLHRPDDKNRGLLECIIAKQRNGPVDDTFLHFNGGTQQFTQTDERPSLATTSRGLRAA